jgi:hypothetical protein
MYRLDDTGFGFGAAGLLYIGQKPGHAAGRGSDAVQSAVVDVMGRARLRSAPGLG